MLDENLLATPEIAIGQADKAVILLSETVGKAFSTASAIRQDPELAREVDILCERSHRYQEQIDAYLTRISSGELGKKERRPCPFPSDTIRRRSWRSAIL